MKDIHNKILAAELIAPNIYDGDIPSAPVDLVDYEAAEVLLHIGAGGIPFTDTARIDFKLMHSEDGSNYSAVKSSDLVGSPPVGEGGIIKSLTAAHATASLDQFGYIGGKRYLKLLADFSGTHETGTPIAALVVKGQPHQMR
jgi:hypothetical protein